MFAELKRLMMQSGLSTFQIARRAKCCQQTLDLWLDGKTKEPSLRVALRVAAVLGRSIELGDEPRLVVDTPASAAAKAIRAREFVGLWRRYQ